MHTISKLAPLSALLASFLAACPALAGPPAGPETPMDAPIFTPGSAGDEPLAAVASNGTGYLVAMARTLKGQGHKLVVARIDAAGTVLDPAGIEIAPVPDAVQVAVASNGTDYLVTWRNDQLGAAKAVRLTAGGAVLDPGGFDLPGHWAPGLVFAGGNYVVEMDKGFHAATRVTPGGVVLDNPRSGSPEARAASSRRSWTT